MSARASSEITSRPRSAEASEAACGHGSGSLWIASAQSLTYLDELAAEVPDLAADLSVVFDDEPSEFPLAVEESFFEGLSLLFGDESDESDESDDEEDEDEESEDDPDSESLFFLAPLLSARESLR